MADGKDLAAAYRRAGYDFLASRLEGLFRKISNDEDIALHNVIQKEVMSMVGDQPVKFFQALAHKVLEERAKRSFRQMVSESILGVAKG